MALTLITPDGVKFEKTRIFLRNFTGKPKFEDPLGRHSPSFAIKVSKDENEMLRAHGVHTERVDGEDYLRVPVGDDVHGHHNRISIRLDIAGKPLFVPMPMGAWGQLDAVDAFYNIQLQLHTLFIPGTILRAPDLNTMTMLHKYREDSPLAG